MIIINNIRNLVKIVQNQITTLNNNINSHIKIKNIKNIKIKQRDLIKTKKEIIEIENLHQHLLESLHLQSMKLLLKSQLQLNQLKIQ